MLPREIVRQIRRLQVRARRAVHNIMGGEYHSIFRGRGLVFDEVREYQPGDDVRIIDWNVTARMGHPYVKRFVEERELTVVLLVDLSRSLQFGSGLLEKKDVIAELAAVLAFSAIYNRDRIGLIGFTDRVERFVPPRRDTRHVLRLVRDILFFKPSGRGTGIGPALDFLNRILHRRAIVFLFSDFHDRDFAAALKRTARRHELIAVRLTDVREEELPPIGLLELEDAESGEQILLDTNNPRLRSEYARRAQERRRELSALFHAAGVESMEIATDGSHLDSLVRFFQRRERQLRRIGSG